MDFRTALSTIYNNRKSEEELSDSTLVHARMTDLLGDDYESKKKLKLFFEIDKRLHLFALVASVPDCTVETLHERYSEVSDIVSERAYDTLAELVICAVRGIVPETKADNPEPEVHAGDSNAGAGSSSVSSAASEADRGEPEPEPHASDDSSASVGSSFAENIDTGAVSSPSTSSSASTDGTWHSDIKESSGRSVRTILGMSLGFWKTMGITACVMSGIAVVLLMFLSHVVFSVPWSAYQWILAGASSIVVLTLIGGLMPYFDKEFWTTEYPVLTNVLYYVLFAVDLLMWLIFRSAYRNICFVVTPVIWLSFPAFMMIAHSTGYGCFDDYCGELEEACVPNFWIGFLVFLGITLLNIFL